jgi:hypothetical protein
MTFYEKGLSLGRSSSPVKRPKAPDVSDAQDQELRSDIKQLVSMIGQLISRVRSPGRNLSGSQSYIALWFAMDALIHLRASFIVLEFRSITYLAASFSRQPSKNASVPIWSIPRVAALANA